MESSVSSCLYEQFSCKPFTCSLQRTVKHVNVTNIVCLPFLWHINRKVTSHILHYHERRIFKFFKQGNDRDGNVWLTVRCCISRIRRWKIFCEVDITQVCTTAAEAICSILNQGRGGCNYTLFKVTLLWVSYMRPATCKRRWIKEFSLKEA